MIHKLLIFFLLLSGISKIYGQWFEHSCVDESFWGDNIGGVRWSGDIKMVNNSTGIRLIHGSRSSSYDWWAYTYFDDYTKSNSLQPTSEWQIGFSGLYTYDTHVYSPEKAQFLGVDTVIFMEIVSDANFYSLNRSFDKLGSEDRIFSTFDTVITDYYFINSNYGLICLNTSNSEIMINYSKDKIDTVYNIKNSRSSKIVFINDSIGFLQRENLITNKISLFRSNSAGKNWFCVIESLDAALEKIDFVSDSTGFITLSDNSILKTTDTGNIWATLNHNDNKFKGVHDFVTEDLWYTVIDNTSLFKTYDQGQNWIYDSLTLSKIVDIEISSDTIGYAISNDCKLYSKGKNVNSKIKNDNSKIEKVKVFPNPAKDFFEVKLSNNYQSIIRVNDLYGNLIIQDTFKKHIILNTKNINTGVYIISIESDKNIISKKIIVH